MLRRDPTVQVATQVPIVREELKADRYGAAAAPGVVEGTARLIMGADPLSELKKGAIQRGGGFALQGNFDQRQSSCFPRYLETRWLKLCEPQLLNKPDLESQAVVNSKTANAGGYNEIISSH